MGIFFSKTETVTTNLPDGVTAKDYETLKSDYEKLEKENKELSKRPEKCSVNDSNVSSVNSAGNVDLSKYIELSKYNTLKAENDKLRERPESCPTTSTSGNSSSNLLYKKKYEDLNNSVEITRKQFEETRKKLDDLLVQYNEKKKKVDMYESGADEWDTDGNIKNADPQKSYSSLEKQISSLTNKVSNLESEAVTAKQQADQKVLTAQQEADTKIKEKDKEIANQKQTIEKTTNEYNNFKESVKSYTDLKAKIGGFADWVGKPFMFVNQANGNKFRIRANVRVPKSNKDIIDYLEDNYSSLWLKRSTDRYYYNDYPSYNVNDDVIYLAPNNGTNVKTDIFTVDSAGHILLYYDKSRCLLYPSKANGTCEGSWKIRVVDLSNYSKNDLTLFTFKDNSICLQVNPDLVIDTVGGTQQVADGSYYYNNQGQLCACGGRGADDNKYNIVGVGESFTVLGKQFDASKVVSLLILIIVGYFILYNIYKSSWRGIGYKNNFDSND